MRTNANIDFLSTRKFSVLLDKNKQRLKNILYQGIYILEPSSGYKAEEMSVLTDYNNSYASCERVFHPKLEFKPVLALPNNDGCVIGNSNEVKALSIKMGEPAFKNKEIIRYMFSQLI